MIATPRELDLPVPVFESFHDQTDEELTKNDIKQMGADEQDIQTIILGLSKDVYTAVDSCETAKEIWERVRQMMKVRQTNNLHKADFTQIYDFLKMNQDEDRQTQNVGGNGGNQFGQYTGQVAQNQQWYNAWQNGGIQVAQNAIQNASVQSGGNQNGLVVVQRIANQNGTGNVFAARAEGDLDKIEEVNANYILMANLQHVSTSGTQLDKAPVYDTDGSAEVQINDNCYDNDIFIMFFQEEQYTNLLEPIPEPQLVPQNDNHVTSVASSMVQSGGTVETSSAPNEEIRAHQETVYCNLVNEVAQEDKFLDKEVDLEAKTKDLENVLLKKDQTKLESKIVELEFQVVNYERKISHLKTTYKNLFDSITSNRAHAKLHNLIYENAQLRARVFENTSETSVTPHVDKPKLSVVTPHSKKLHASILSHFVPQPREFNVVKHRNVIAPEMFKINPSQTSRVDLVPNKQSSTSIRINPITNSQRHVTFKDNVSFDTVTASSTGLVHTVRTRRPQPKGNTRNARVHSASKSSEVKKNITVEDHRRTLLLSKNHKTMLSDCNTIKLAIQNDKSKIVCGTCKQCLVTANHDACLLSSVNALNSHANNLCANVPPVQIKRDIGHSFDLKGKLVASKETNCPNDDKACTSNPQELMRKRFPNSTVFLGRLSKFVCVFGTVRFGNDHIAAILGYGDLKWGNITITRVYFVEGTLASLVIWMVLTYSKAIILQIYTPSISMTWPQLLPYVSWPVQLLLSRGYDINDYTTSTSTPSTTLPKMISSSVYQSLNMPKNIFVPLVSKEKAKEPLTHPNLFRIQNSDFICFIWICVVQCELQALMEYFDSVGITHETSAAKTPQQNERRNYTLVEAARTMLIFSHASLFLWAEAIATACYTQNHSIIHRRFNKTPYELIQGRKPNISYLYNDREDIGKLGAKGDIGFFIGYSANYVAYMVYNWRKKNHGDDERFIDADHISHAYKLKKALYGLKQALRAWYDELSTFLLQNRFSKGTIDLMLFTRRFDDDILVVNQSPSGIFINQSNYVNEILKKYGLNTCDIIGTPMDIKDKLDLDQVRTPVNATKYRSMIGALMYLTSSRPGIVHSTCDSGFELTGFSDADYAGCKDTFKSTSLTDYGYHFDKIPIYCYSKSAIAISCNPIQHSRTKHIAVRYHFIKEHVEKGTIELYFVKIDYQLADIFTKALPVDIYNYLVRRIDKCCFSWWYKAVRIGICSMTQPELEGSTKDTPIDKLEVLRYDSGKRSKERTRIMPTETELTPEQTQQDDDTALVHSSNDEDVVNAHIPKVNLKQDWWKPLEEDRPATPEPAWSIPSSNLPTDDMAIFMDWFCKKQGITKLKPQDLEGPAFDLVDESIIRYNVSKPLPLGGPPGQVTIQSDFFFNKDLEYLRYGSKGGKPTLSISKMKASYYPDVSLEHTSEGDLRAVRTHMRILSVVRIEVFSIMIKKEKSENKERVPTEMELELEQNQQGYSYEVSVQRIENKAKTNPALEQLVLVGSLSPHTRGRWFDSAGGLYVPSTTSTTDVAATWICGTQSADVALPRRLTCEQHANMAADVSLSERRLDKWEGDTCHTRYCSSYAGGGYEVLEGVTEDGVAQAGNNWTTRLPPNPSPLWSANFFRYNVDFLLEILNENCETSYLIMWFCNACSQVKAKQSSSCFYGATTCSPGNSFLKRKTEKSDYTLVQLMEERERLKKKLEKTKNQKEKLESLCRSLQAERKQNPNGQSNPDSVPAV
uniref:Reverse transcriptase Ty1/copia-type domain-containing protein n=1 Tax=Tanacetum cinerariifolium TaxID=118510 RepID=A0A6L2P639_TANCI|nr:hypothetical protein [Tanacetum cinerariifolium]